MYKTYDVTIVVTPLASGDTNVFTLTGTIVGQEPLTILIVETQYLYVYVDEIFEIYLIKPSAQILNSKYTIYVLIEKREPKTKSAQLMFYSDEQNKTIENF